MGRPPTNGGPVFRFIQKEVLEMEACLLEVNNAIPSRETIVALANKFSESPDRAGKIIVQPKQVWNWFQNRRYAQRAKSVKAPAKLNISPMPRNDAVPFKNVAPPLPVPSGKSSSDTPQVEFEAKSARDGAWYDVATFLSHRMFETGEPEVRVRFTGFGVEEDEWINVIKHVRQRSLPCESGECVVVLPGDPILCFQEGKEQALYYDAHVLDAQRRRHDVRGCRCRFLVRYDHDQSEEIVPLRKICRRPETDHRLQMLAASRASGSAELRPTLREPSAPSPSKDVNMMSPAKVRKQRKLMDVNTDEVTTVPLAASTVENSNLSAPDVPMEDATVSAASEDKPQEVDAAGN